VSRLGLDFSEFRCVVVSGPQRSGTTIASRIIALENDMEYVDESAYGTKNKEAWGALVIEGDNLVIQSPAMARYLHQFGDCLHDVAFVWMIRPLHEIIASQNRIGWSDSDERKKYDQIDNTPIALVKTLFWRIHQCPMISYSLELGYHDLTNHRLWVPDDDRIEFTRRQWQVVA